MITENTAFFVFVTVRPYFSAGHQFMKRTENHMPVSAKISIQKTKNRKPHASVSQKIPIQKTKLIKCHIYSAPHRNFK